MLSRDDDIQWSLRMPIDIGREWWMSSSLRGCQEEAIWGVMLLGMGWAIAGEACLPADPFLAR